MDRSVNVCNIVRLCNKVCKLRTGRGFRNVTSKRKDELREISSTKLLKCRFEEKLLMFKSLNLPPLPQGNREGVVTPNTCKVDANTECFEEVGIREVDF